MPRQILGRPQGHVHAAGARDDSHRLERISRLYRAARAPGASRLAQSGQHRRDVLGLPGQRGIQHGDLIIGRPPVNRDQPDTARLLGRLDHLGDGEQRDVDQPSGHVAHQGFQQGRQQRGRQLRTIGLQRVEHPRGHAP